MPLPLRLTLLLCAAFSGGCGIWLNPPPAMVGTSPLKPIEMASDGMRLEVIFARVGYGDPAFNDTMWTQIDEQQVPPEVHRALEESGIRLGLVGSELPLELGELVAEAETPVGAALGASLETAPPVSRRQMQLHSGWRGELVTSATYPEMPLLVRGEQGVSGRTFKSAQGVFNVRVSALGNRRVKLQITPEIQHGEAQQQFLPEDGVFRPQSGKKKEPFDSLAFEVTIAPGQMLVLTTCPDRPGTLGHYFFTEDRGGYLQQKIVVVRLDQSRFTDLFTTAETSDRIDAPPEGSVTVLR